jgi:Recombinase
VSHFERRINNEEAEVIKKIFRLYREGHGFTTIAKTLNAEHAPCPRPAPRWSSQPQRRPEQDWLIEPVPTLRIIEESRGWMRRSIGRTTDISICSEPMASCMAGRSMARNHRTSSPVSPLATTAAEASTCALAPTATGAYSTTPAGRIMTVDERAAPSRCCSPWRKWIRRSLRRLNRHPSAADHRKSHRERRRWLLSLQGASGSRAFVSGIRWVHTLVPDSPAAPSKRLTCCLYLL